MVREARFSCLSTALGPILASPHLKLPHSGPFLPLGHSSSPVGSYFAQSLGAEGGFPLALAQDLRQQGPFAAVSWPQWFRCPRGAPQNRASQLQTGLCLVIASRPQPKPHGACYLCSNFPGLCDAADVLVIDRDCPNPHVCQGIRAGTISPKIHLSLMKGAAFILHGKPRPQHVADGARPSPGNLPSLFIELYGAIQARMRDANSSESSGHAKQQGLDAFHWRRARLHDVSQGAASPRYTACPRHMVQQSRDAFEAAQWRGSLDEPRSP